MKLLEVSRQGYAAFFEKFNSQSWHQLYQSDTWLELIEETFGLSFCYFTFVDHKEVHGVCAVAEVPSLVPFKSRFLCTPYLPVGAFCFAGDDRQRTQALQILFDHYKGKRLELRLAGATVAPMSGIFADYSNFSMTIELAATKNEQWEKFRAKTRNQIRKGEKAKLEFAVGRLGHLDDFYGVYCRVMQNLASPPHSKVFFSSLLRSFSHSRIVALFSGDKCIAAGLLLYKNAGNASIPWSACLPEYNNQCANYVLYWKCIEFLISEGCRVFDLGRTQREAGTFRFKKNLGAEEAPLIYLRNYKTKSLQKMKSQAGPISKIWRRTPRPIANLIGSRIRPFIP